MPHCFLPAISTLVLTLLLAGMPAVAAANDPVGERLRHRLESVIEPMSLEAAGQTLFTTSLLRELYEARGFQTLWLDEGRPLPALAELPEAIAGAHEEGLNPQDYHLEALQAVMAEFEASGSDLPPRYVVDLELLATDAFLTLAKHYADGKVDPTRIDPSWFLSPRDTDLLPILDATLRGDLGSVIEATRGLLPSQPAYGALRDRLALQREFDASGEWTRVPPGPTLRRGDRGERVEALTRRLAELGDLETAWAENGSFDAIVEDAARRFQTRHGLEPDAVVGPRTLAALNVSPAERIAQLQVNMERWRWLPPDLGTEYILVNIASFSMSVHADGEEVFRQPVVVGRPYRRTPVFSHRMTYLVLNPSWEVPPRLAAQDQLPLIRRDPEHLERMGFDVLRGWGAAEERIDPATVDWLSVSASRFPFRLRQRPGPLNALGQVKFMFPNQHNVYLHDTPARGTFASADRALSSGCIRLSDPMALTEWLLARPGRPPIRTPQQIAAILESGVETTVRLRTPVPVHLLYWTAWVESDGRVHYTGDIYQRDGAVLEALLLPPPSQNPTNGSVM